VVVYFGYPAAHEDDTEQAVRAALDLFTAIQRLPAPPGMTLRVRIGIATGLSIVYDLPLVGETRDGGIVGEAPVVAGLLQGLAEPGTVIVDKTTRALVGELFNCRDLGASAQARQVSGVRDVEHRFEALRGASADRAGSAAGHGRLAG
jgi:class 3 adenylate cyclase